MPPEENEDGQEKSEAPTGRRRSKARNKGSVARSKEINSAVVLFFALITAAIYGPYMMDILVNFIKFVFSHYPEIVVNSNNTNALALSLILFVFKLIAPILIVLIIVGVIANLAQFGWLWTTQTIFQGMKNFSLNPTKLLGRVFGKSNWVTLGINMLKLILLFWVVWGTLKREFANLPALIELPLLDSFQYMAEMLFWLALKIIMLLVIIAIIDYVWERHKHEKSLKMTKIEVKEEKKQVDGDPMVRAKIRGIMQKASMDRMMNNVPEADVVITNPVHVAVAIKYDRETMASPQVIAKGARLIAEKIKDIARNTSVPIIENRILAQTLYKTVEVGQEIPPKLYQAVAEVLAYVYQLNKAKKERAAI